MKFNNILETIFVGSLTFFITFSSVVATNVANDIDVETDENKNSFYNKYINFLSSSLFKNENSQFEFHPLIETYLGKAHSLNMINPTTLVEDSTCKLNWCYSYDGHINGFMFNLICDRLDNRFQHHSLITEYLNGLDNLYISIQKPTGESMDSISFKYYNSHLDKNNRFVDVLSSSNISIIDEGVYNISLFSGKKLIGLFNNVMLKEDNIKEIKCSCDNMFLTGVDGNICKNYSLQCDYVCSPTYEKNISTGKWEENSSFGKWRLTLWCSNQNDKFNRYTCVFRKNGKKFRTIELNKYVNYCSYNIGLQSQKDYWLPNNIVNIELYNNDKLLGSFKNVNLKTR